MTVEIEAKRIEHQMNTYMKSKQKAKYQPSYFTRGISGNTIDDIEQHVIQEKQKHNKKVKSWNTMLKCDQWSLLKTFLDDEGKKSNESLKYYRHALVAGNIKVDLNRDTGKITNIEVIVA